MNCPVCDAQLRVVNKHGVEVDICPDCKGVWLDRGELDKIMQMVGEGGPTQSIDRNVPEERPREYREQPREQIDRRGPEPERYREDKRHYDERGIDPRTGKRKKKESWFGEIFEMFGD